MSILTQIKFEKVIYSQNSTIQYKIQNITNVKDKVILTKQTYGNVKLVINIFNF